MQSYVRGQEKMSADQMQHSLKMPTSGHGRRQHLDVALGSGVRVAVNGVSHEVSEEQHDISDGVSDGFGTNLSNADLDETMATRALTVSSRQSAGADEGEYDDGEVDEIIQQDIAKSQPTPRAHTIPKHQMFGTMSSRTKTPASYPTTTDGGSRTGTPPPIRQDPSSTPQPVGTPTRVVKVSSNGQHKTGPKHEVPAKSFTTHATGIPSVNDVFGSIPFRGETLSSAFTKAASGRTAALQIPRQQPKPIYSALPTTHSFQGLPAPQNRSQLPISGQHPVPEQEPFAKDSTFSESPEQNSPILPAQSIEPEFTPDELHSMSFDELRARSVDSKPAATITSPPHPAPQDDTPEAIIKCALAVAGHERQEERVALMARLSLPEWEVAGAHLVQHMSDAISKIVSIRQDKRRLAQEFEIEIEKRHHAVERKKLAIEASMAEMRKEGGRLMAIGTPPPRRR